MASKQRNLAEAVLYGHPPTYHDLAPLLQNVLDSGAKRITIQFVVSEDPLTTTLRSTRGDRLKIEAEASAHSASSSSISGKATAMFGGKRGRVAGRFVAVQHPSFPLVWLLATHESSDFVAGPLELMVEYARPRALYPILATKSIRELLQFFESQPAVSDLRVSQVGSRSLLGGDAIGRSIEAERRWTNLSLDEATRGIRSEDKWATDITVIYTAEGRWEASLKISRRGRLTLRDNLSDALPAFLDRTAQLVVSRYQFLKGRDREQSPESRPRPFRIDFKAAVLAEPEQLASLREVLHDIPNVSCTILHGNPYFHAVLVDYVDGSSYELIALAPTHLTVVPQRRSTVLALQRLCERIFAGFHEGDIVERAAG